MADDQNTQAVRLGSRETWKTRIRCSMRLLAAYAIEAEVSNAASCSENFVRGLESAALDGGIVIPEFILPAYTGEERRDDQTDRFFQLWPQHADSPEPVLIPIDIKSFAYHVKVEETEYDYGYRLTKYLGARINMTKSQQEHCQALLISSVADREWVALVPRYYFKKMAFDTAFGQTVTMSTVPVAMGRANPLPPILAPFVMRKTDLPEAFADMISNYLYPQYFKLKNPYSGLEYSPDISVEARQFSLICSGNNSEAALRYKIWKAYQDCAPAYVGAPDYHIRNPACCPLTADLRIDHSSGSSLFIELKQDHARVSADGKTFSHQQYAVGRGKRGIFTFRAVWDYLLTMVDDNTGYLILKEDIPRSFWHREPGPDNWLHHVFPSDTFLNRRRVRLDDEPLAIVRRLTRIFSGAYAVADPPKKSLMTAKDIWTLAGPCSAKLLGLEASERIEIEDDDPGADDYLPIYIDDGDDDQVQGQDQDPDQEMVEPAGGANAAGGAAGRPRLTKFGLSRGEEGFRTLTVDDRFKRDGGLDAEQAPTLFRPLLAECRRTGKGCVLDLGKFHPFGRIGMVRYTWSDEDKARYDQSERPPCWAGMLGSNVPMVTLCSQWNRWRINYAPDEPTLGQLEHYRRAHPCIVVSSALPKELSHMIVQRWLVPSEFMPTIQLGNLKEVHTKAPLILQQQHDIEEFIVAEADLHATIYEFLSGKEVIHVGFDSVEIDPKPYLKRIGDYKVSGEVNFETCATSTEGEGPWNKLAPQHSEGRRRIRRPRSPAA